MYHHTGGVVLCLTGFRWGCLATVFVASVAVFDGEKMHKRAYSLAGGVLREVPMTVSLAVTLATGTAAMAQISHAEPNRQHLRPVPAEVWSSLPAHPRVLATEAQFQAIRGRAGSEPTTQLLIELVKADAEAALTAPPIGYVDTGSFVLGQVRSAQGRIFSTAMMFRLTGEEKYLREAREELLTLAALPDWFPSHFLGVGEASLACAVGLDWLHEELLPHERDAIATAIVRNALLPSLEMSDEGWPTAEHNWNPVCHAGLVAGALAIADREPALAQRVIQRAISQTAYAAASYAPDGTFPEGPSYWSYGTTFYVILIECLRSSLGGSFGLEGAPGFLESIDYLAHVTAPSGKDFNYADYHTRSAPEPVALWFARELGRSDIAAKEIFDLKGRLAAVTSTGAATNPSTPERHLALELLWWNPTVLTTPPALLPTYWIGRGAMPLGVFRSSWSDAESVYVAVKGGTPNGSHAHMDVGSFILEADGVRWAIDLGTENYNKMRAAKLDLWNYSQDSSRWSVFRNGPEGHNVIRFDNQLQTAAGFAKIDATEGDAAGRFGAVVDLQSLYAGQVADVRRTVRLNADRSVTISDQWRAGGQPVVAGLQWLTRAEVTRVPNGVRLNQAGKSLDINIETDGSYEVDVEDVSQPRGVQDSANPGVRRIVVRVATAAGESRSVRLRSVPGSFITHQQ